jgi:leucyl-tRNA synthetase
MPGWAGSSWYWMRYMDAHNTETFANEDALKYWESVDLYIGGSEHATGHLLYARFWNKFLKDRGYAPTEEPFKKLINQGMILGNSAFVFRINRISLFKTAKPYVLNDKEISYSISDLIRSIPSSFAFVSKNLLYESTNFKDSVSPSCFGPDVAHDPNKKNDLLNHSFKILDLSDFEIESVYKGEILIIYNFSPIHVDLSCINDINNELDIEKFISHPLYSDYAKVEFISNNNKFLVGREVEKMSKSKYNVVSPDDICEEYGADTLRLYEMFLGPLEQSKPWNTAGITGVSGFLKKLWRLYFDDNGSVIVNEEPTADMYKSLHKTIKKVTEDIENFSFNTSVSQFMICVNELQQLKCNHRAILEPLAILVSPYAPHIAEELWSALGHEGSISTVAFPKFEEKYLIESEKEYPVSFNGKMRFTIKLPLDLTAAQIEEIVMADERTQAQLQGRTPNKVIIVPGKIINLVG